MDIFNIITGEPVERCSLPHAAMHVIHLIIFRSSDEPPEFAPKMLSKLSFIIPNAASIILNREKGRKKVWKTQKTTPNHRNTNSHATNIVTWPL